MKLKLALALAVVAGRVAGADSLHAPKEPLESVVVVHGLGRLAGVR